MNSQQYKKLINDMGRASDALNCGDLDAEEISAYINE